MLTESFHETIELINEICELFKPLKILSIDLPKIEKISILYNSLPKELQSKVTYSSFMKVSNFYSEIKDKYIMLSYHQERKYNHFPRFNIQKSRNNSGKTSNNNEYDDKMNLDNIECHNIN